MRVNIMMKILVCIKEVPESDAPILIDESGRWIRTDDSHYYRMNRFDEFAVEEALLIKDAVPGVTIDVLTVGPPRVVKMLRRAIGMGVDNAVHIVTSQPGYVSPFLTSSWIASYGEVKGYELVLTGVMAEDDMQGLVGPMLAELLHLPYATSTILERLSHDRRTIYVEREIEGGLREALEIKLPAVLTIQSGINRPRYPSLSNMLRANKTALETIQAESLGQPAIRDQVVRVDSPQKSRAGVVLEGTPQEKAAQLVDILSQKSLLY